MTRPFCLLLAALSCATLFAQKKETIKLLPDVVPVIDDYLFAANAELTNGQYRSYLAELKQQSTTAWEVAYPDTTVWISGDEYTYNGPLVNHYLSHPAYGDYPVVGVSHKQAQDYCAWLTAKLEKMCEACENPTNQVIVRLPTEQEWELAALSGLPAGSLFPWEGNSMRNPEKKHLGNFMANFVQGRSSHQGTTGHTDINAMFTTPVLAYFPNEIGLYNMAGNVAEMTNIPGQTKGGSWKNTGAYLQVNGDDPYAGWTGSSSQIGFRYFVEVVGFAAKPHKKTEELSARLIEGWMASVSEAGDLFAGNTEVSNGMYKRFLDAIEISDPVAWEKHQIQHALWSQESHYVIKQQYGMLPQFDHYPVVNISYASAVAFCDWLTQTYAGFEDREFEHAHFRLPSQEEWEASARGGLETHAAYPWGGPYICNARGCFLCNFNPQELRFLKRDDEGNDYFDYPNFDMSISRGLDGRTWIGTVTDYMPNDYGLYNCAGNAAEMVADEGISKGGSWTSTSYHVQISSTDTYTGPSPSLGFRVFMTNTDSTSAGR